MNVERWLLTVVLILGAVSSWYLQHQIDALKDDKAQLAGDQSEQNRRIAKVEGAEDLGSLNVLHLVETQSDMLMVLRRIDDRLLLDSKSYQDLAAAVKRIEGVVSPASSKMGDNMPSIWPRVTISPDGSLPSLKPLDLGDGIVIH